MKTSINKTNNTTEIRRPFDAEWVQGQLALGLPVLAEANNTKIHVMSEDRDNLEDSPEYAVYDPGKFDWVYGYEIDFTLTILPPLPRKPTPEDAPLLYRYMAEGVIIYVEGKGVFIASEEPEILRVQYSALSGEHELGYDWIEGFQEATDLIIAYALDPDGNKVEIALTDKEEKTNDKN